jgi:hypothetical protein
MACSRIVCRSMEEDAQNCCEVVDDFSWWNNSCRVLIVQCSFKVDRPLHRG